MENRVKIVPENNVKDVTLGNLLETNEETIKVSIPFKNNFETYQLFELICEEDNILNIFKANLMKKENDIYSFKLASNPKKIFKREYERCIINLEVTDNKKYQAQTTDISAGGMQISSEKPLKQNKTYKLSIIFDERKIDVEYLVLRITEELGKKIMAGKFTNISQQDKAFIIQQNLKKKLDLRYKPKEEKTNGEDVDVI